MEHTKTKRTPEISASEVLHGILSNKTLKTVFHAGQLADWALAEGHTISSGAVGGFITRARNKGMLNRHLTISNWYILEEKVEWDFKPRGVGSSAGRKLHVEDRHKLPKPLQTLVDGNEPDVDAKPEPLSERLLGIAAQLAQFELRDTRTLAEYTSEELLAELGKRVARG